MISLRSNVIANYLGQGWTAVMGLAFIPLYIKYLGVESYGLIGVYAVLQAWLTLLDMGMTPTLSREMARYTAGAHTPQSIRNLLRSMEILCLGLAVLIGVGVWAGSSYIATGWLNAEELPTAVVAQALSVMAFAVALRFLESIYRGSLFGLQWQVWYNGANAVLSTVRYGGAVAVLAWVAPTIELFFIWQAVVSVLTVIVLAAKVRQVLPKAPTPAKFSRQVLGEVWKFASGMMGITFLALLLTQVDKILLSGMLPLETFGYYTLAATVAGALYIVIGPITQAMFPRMVELYTKNDQAALVSIYHQGAQLVTVLAAPVVMLLTFFAGGILFMWTGDARLAESAAPILSVLVLGTFLNGLMWMPYQCQLAHGWTGLTLKVNVVAVVALVPAIFWVVPKYGAVGAAWIWVVLNAGYVLIAIHYMHRRLLPKEKWRWYSGDVLLPLIGTIGVMLLVQQLQPASYQDRWHWFAFLLVSVGLALLASIALAEGVRSRLVSFMDLLVRRRYS